MADTPTPESAAAALEFLAMPPWWVVLALALGLVVWGVKVIRWTGRVDSRIEALTERVDRLARAIGEIREDIKSILSRPAPTPPTVQSSSPIQLTDFGKKVSATAAAAAWAEANAPRLEGRASGKEEFEVFELCVEYVGERLENDTGLDRKVREAAYEHGAEREQVRKVYEVELRDRVLALFAASDA